MTAQILKFRPRRDDDWVRAYLRSVYLDASLPFDLRVRAVVLAPYVGEDVSKVMRDERQRA